MRTFIKNNKPFIYISLLSLIGGFFRFYKLDWAQGLFTHPDEYHIVASVNQLSFPNQMHPHFFSYGTVIIYLIYFTKEIANLLSATLNLFIVGRFFSALFSTLSIIIVYKICRSFMQPRFSYLAAFLLALTPGLIQQAHFATPESALTFFLFGSLLFTIKFLKKNRVLYLALSSVFLGFALGVKVSSIVFLLPLIVTIIIKSYPKNLSFKTLLKFTGLTLTSIIIATATFVIVAPYVFLDFPAFRGNLEYEGALAFGKIPVFYTRQFIDTLPIIFQTEKILPYALGPALLLFSTVGLIFLAVNLIRKPKIELIVLVLTFLSLFLTNAFLFAKWTRFIAPTFPFFAIFSAYLLEKLEKKARLLFYSLRIVLVVTTLFWTMAFFSIYTNPDVRILASEWLKSNSPPGSRFLVEGGNMIDLPLGGLFPRTSLDFYNLEENPSVRERVADALYTSDYFLVQSRRVFMNHQRLPHLFPKTARLYDSLFSGELGFEQIKEFHSYPKLSFVGLSIEFPDEKAEETWSVFDHPVIRVFKKTEQLPKENYAKFLEN